MAYRWDGRLADDDVEARMKKDPPINAWSVFSRNFRNVLFPHLKYPDMEHCTSTLKLAREQFVRGNIEEARRIIEAGRAGLRNMV